MEAVVVFMKQTRFARCGCNRGSRRAWGERGYRHPISNLGDEDRFTEISADRAPRAESLTHNAAPHRTA